ncbi:DNA polymerase Y family protein [Actinoplanes oblitus]|uniref:DNA polymerase Y family protein n=1 Tax=Actinoplanes oblitus TaxID=3040509 RepID=A0ABY8WW09_9ACTN|nr:DNA polymerase Y family protein [Actinoplanes oblitus]WIN00740.1 DNA polymerase Y family protein [Actinoplanes oblitus]
MGDGVRTLLLWCPDWPVVAAEIVLGVPAAEPVAVFAGNRVLACSEAARRETVRRGLRRRDAQGRCPQLIVVEHDPGRDARAFEPVVAAVEEVAAGVEVIRPGACALAARGPSRYYGGEEAAAERIVEHVAQSCAVESQAGIADGVFAAGIAARSGRIVPPGETPEFLAGMPVEALERPELTDLLRRLGTKTLGEFAALPSGDVLTRFGFDGALAHRLARGGDHRPLAVRQPPPDLAVEETYDEPLARVDTAAFAGRVLAERLHERLAGYGLACTRLGVEAVTADGQELHRVWRHDGLLTAAAIAERVRWQLDGWLTGARRNAAARPTAGLVRLSLIPGGILAHAGLQPGLWGDAGAERDRAHRAFSRVQGLLGPEAVVTPVLGGGRSGDDQVRLVPWGDERSPARPATVHADPIPDLRTVPVLDRAVAPELPGMPARRFPVPVAPLSVITGGARGGEAREGGARGREAREGEVREGEVREGEAREGEAREGEAGEGEVGEARRGEGHDAGPPARREVVAASPGADAPGVRKKHPDRRKTSRPPLLPPWPGRLPRPSPAMVLPQPLPAVVHDETGLPVGVSARLELTGVPTTLTVDRSAPLPITGWAGPWPVDERWWAPEEARRRARFQMCLADGRALLLALAAGQWTVEAIYD